MDRTTGRALDGLAHLRQSIADILFTPVGTRLARRSYGSLLPELIDHPNNAATRVLLYSAVAGALMRWEPRLRLSRVQLFGGTQAGQSELQLDGLYIPDVLGGGRAQVLALRLPLQLRASNA